MHHMQTWVAFCCFGASTSFLKKMMSLSLFIQMYFLSFFIPLQWTRGIFHMLGFSSIEIRYIFLKWWVKVLPKARARATQHFMQTWDGWLLSCRSNVDDSNYSEINSSRLFEFKGCFPFSGTIVVLHDLLPDTGWHCGQTCISLPSFHYSFFKNCV